MNLSDKQKDVLHKIYDFEFEKPFFLGGFAGTGKTTLLRQMEEDHPGQTLFLAPTGKACQVLKTKLPFSADVRTIHSFLYTPVEVTPRTIARWEQEAEDGSQYAQRCLDNYYKHNFSVEFMDTLPDLSKKMIVVDESSMVGRREFSKLVDLGVPLVFVGDPFQLPPVQSASIMPSSYNDFDGFLYEVHRAALDSPITRLSMSIREGDFRGVQEWEKEGIVYSTKTSLETLRSVDQVITGMNRSRWKLNRVMRRPETSPEVRVGDKVILKENIRGRGGSLKLVNGDIGYVEGLNTQTRYPYMKVRGMAEESAYISYTDTLFQQNYGKGPTIPEQKKPKNFKVDYAYAITCHASQGSEWPSVLVYDDKMMASQVETRLRWLYTAVTRAKEKLIYVEK